MCMCVPETFVLDGPLTAYDIAEEFERSQSELFEQWLLPCNFRRDRPLKYSPAGNDPLNTAVALRLHDHMRMLQTAFQEARDDSRQGDVMEHPWYEGWNLALSYLCSIWGCDEWYLSTVPQGRVSHRYREDGDRSMGDDTGIRYLTRGQIRRTGATVESIPDVGEDDSHESVDDMSIDSDFDPDLSLNSNPPDKDEEEKGKYRLVDFLTLRRERHNPFPDSKVIIVSTEIKALPYDIVPVHVLSKSARLAFSRALLCQVIQQVQFAFYEFEHQDVITAISAVGDWCRFFVFERSHTPPLTNKPAPKDRYRPKPGEKVAKIPVYSTKICRVVDYTENGLPCSDYSAAFKKEWADAMDRVPLTTASGMAF
ncbi:hypothetical protein PLICRDRAFT_41753 [Plicaturopsis crispa FD-325 SS-3]|nr:hypothetical protein PLICRDRAFT_41753 [Plicaturopsis crispa FD-325 SS-3]